GIKRLDSLYCGGEIPRMPYHISVREVEDDSLRLPCTQTRYNRLSNLVGTHLRLQIIGRHFGRRDQQTVFPGKGCFHTPVEEICHMSIFFRFGYTQIMNIMLRENLGQNVIERLRRKGYRQIEIGAIVCQACIVHFWSLWPRETSKLLIGQGSG